jgi:tetratricopeptide (TPR) repeat protein
VFCRKFCFSLQTLALLSLTFLSCSRNASSVVERVAVLPLENAGSDSELDWAGRAAAAALVYDLTGLPDRYLQPVDSISAAYSIHASQILEGYYSKRNGRMELRAVLESLEGKKTLNSMEVEAPQTDGMLPLVNALAKRLSPQARAFGTRNDEAFRLYSAALTATDRPAALRSLESATQADPGFTEAYAAWARILVSQGDRVQADKVIRAAEGSGPDGIERAKLAYLAASAASGAERRIQALDTLTHLIPADSTLFKDRADLKLSQRDFQGAVRDLEVCTRLDPNQPENWNQLGYVLAYAQDLAGARRALENYQRLLPPENANALDSLGEVSFYLGDFAGAANYFLRAQEKNPGQFQGTELVKAAQARLMAGDLRESDALFQKYLASVRSSQRSLTELEQAQWEYLTGRKKAGLARLEKLIPELDPDKQVLGLCQLSIWKMLGGDPKSASVFAAQAAEHAVSPGARNLSAMCRYISATPQSSSGSPLVDAFALLLARRFRDALPVIETLYRETNPLSDGQIRTLLAWAYVETGRTSDADRLLQNYPIPLASGDSMFASFLFPRYLFLRAVTLEKSGKRAEAKQSYELFLKYAGDVPDIFGDAATARQTLGKL